MRTRTYNSSDKALGKGLKELLVQKNISLGPSANESSRENERLHETIHHLTREKEGLEARVRKLESERKVFVDKLFRKGVSELKNGDFLSAAGSLQGVLAYDPGHIKSMINLAVAFSGLEFGGRAISILEQALILDPDNETVKKNLAILKSAGGNK